MLGAALDIFRLRQYFNLANRAREVVEGLREDGGLVHDARRALVRLPGERDGPRDLRPFPPREPLELAGLRGRRLALVATGGSGALASVVGAARALEEAGVRPSVISLCSGSSLFGFPIAAGVPADEVAAFTIGLRPEDYVDVNWGALARIVPAGGRGFAGIVKGARIEATYRRLLGDMRLGELPVPAYAPIWNIEENRVEYLGPRTRPELPVARAVHMAIALAPFVEPVELDGGSWCDGGIVDIFPVRPVLEIEEPCDAALAVNGFYPPGFAGEDATGWRARRASILYAASQVRTAQQVELARVNLARLRDRAEVVMIEPVSYEKVRGVGFYRQFLSTAEWGAFMRAGRLETRRALAGAWAAPPRPAPRPRAQTGLWRVPAAAGAGVSSPPR
ncbi:MAG TPA: patatin-like phospholipase family protein [Acidimicrobiales bacterium]|nr:patatin-like phospholipase family protein [Acidimicrobiales bacterium]